MSAVAAQSLQDEVLAELESHGPAHLLRNGRLLVLARKWTGEDGLLRDTRADALDIIRHWCVASGMRVRTVLRHRRQG